MKRLDDLLSGFATFKERHFNEARFRDLVCSGQKPQMLFVACSDSRVDPALLFDASPGDLFVVRNVANMVPPCERDRGQHGVSAAIEFAVTQLRVRHALVCGHSECGGIRALMERSQEADDTYVARWMRIGEPARAETLRGHGDRPFEEQRRACERANVAHGLANLRSFPFVVEAERAGTLSLHGLYVRLDEGALYRLTEAGWAQAA